MADPVNTTPSVTDSILNSIKKLLMIADDDHAFDVDLMRVRLLFDPPSNASVIKSYEENIRELEWLLNVDAEHVEPEDGE